MTGLPPFHLAFPVHDLAAARAFYGGLLGCPEGRSAADWVDFDFFGHQIVAHRSQGAGRGQQCSRRSPNVPVPHFGAVAMVGGRRLPSGSARPASTSRFHRRSASKGEPGVQATMFFRDPSGNALEIKGDGESPANLFAK